MKKLIAAFIPMLMVVGGAYATGGSRGHPHGDGDTMIEVRSDIDTTQFQDVSVVGGGDSASDSSAVAVGGDTESISSSGASIDTTTISNYRTRTPPVSVFPPYLPYWNHGGWGTIKAYFPNGPNSDDQVYERTFNAGDCRDMEELRGVLGSLPYDGPLDVLGGILNGVGVVFGGPDNYHHGRGFEIANSLIRTRRPCGKPLVVFIDTNVDTRLLKEAGYAYVGQVSLEGRVERNWDHVYDAAVAEALPWDVDILLISGGMKGVTVGSNLAFPLAGGAYSQMNYSISLFGGASNGITEGKGKAVVSAAGYRYWPHVINRRKIPEFIYDKIQAKRRPTQKREKAAPEISPVTRKEKIRGVEVSQQLYELAGF